MYQIKFSPAAKRELKKLTRIVQVQVIEKIEELQNTPFPDGCKKLSGISAKIQNRLGAGSLYRVRSGDYRVIYSVFEKEIIVLVLKIGARKDVYDFLKKV